MPRFKVEYAALYRNAVDIEAKSYEDAVAQFRAKSDMSHLFQATNQQSAKFQIEIEGVTDEAHGVKTLPDGRIVVSYKGNL